MTTGWKLEKNRSYVFLISSDAAQEMAYTMKIASAGFRASSETNIEVALVVLFLLAGVINGASHNGDNMLLANVTRFATGDLFSLIGKYKN